MHKVLHHAAAGLLALAAILALTHIGSAQAQDGAQSEAKRTSAEAMRLAKEAADDAMAAARGVTERSHAVRVRPRVEDPTRLSDRSLRERVAKIEPRAGNYESPEFADWSGGLLSGLKSAPLDGVAATLALRHGLPVPVMQALARAWLVARVAGLDFTNEQALKPARAAFEWGLGEQVKAAGYAPFAIEIAAQALYLAGSCGDAGLAALANGAPDQPRVAWAIARGAPCRAEMRSALADPGLRASALMMLLSANEIQHAAAIAVERWLLREDALAGVDAGERPALRRWLARRLLAHYLAVGMTAEAVAHFSAFDAEARDFALKPETDAFEVRIDGARFRIDADTERLRPALAAAMLLERRRPEAAALLQEDRDLAEKQALVDCMYAAAIATGSDERRKGPACKLDRERTEQQVSDAVDSLWVQRELDGTDRDPYPLIEIGLGSRSAEPSGAIVRLRCEPASARQYAGQCADWRRAVATRLELHGADEHGIADIAEVLAAAHAPGWAEAFAKVEAMRSATLAAFSASGAAPAREAWRERDAIEPDPAPFEARPMPAAMRSIAAGRNKDRDTDRELAWPRGWLPLPGGYAPVRIEARGSRAVAVSLSGRFDPSGEVAAGGYWVHVSDDGGRTWQAPLYTGLADRFPYIVAPRSKMPLIAGDTLRLEVAVALLDTRSITYPPVGLRTLRTASDLYLEMPLARLRADADHDGLTDISAHHLLFDRGPLAPFVVDSDLGTCSAAAIAAQGLRSRLLMRLVGGRQDQALREPVDRPADAPLAFGWAMSPSSRTAPLFIKANRADFACMQIGTPAFVYTAEGEIALQRQTPDFRLLEAPPMVTNREGTRGFMRWSLGWTGGTTLVYRKDGVWHSVEIESWIT